MAGGRELVRLGPQDPELPFVKDGDAGQVAVRLEERDLLAAQEMPVGRHAREEIGLLPEAGEVTHGRFAQETPRRAFGT